MKVTGFFLTFLFLCTSSFAQKDISQLRAALNNPNDSGKINAYNEIFNHYEYSNPDSAIYYLNEGLKYFTDKQNKLGIAKMNFYLAGIDEIQGRLKTAEKRLNETLAIFNELNYKDGIATVNNSIGVMESRAGNYNAATKHFMEALRIFEVTKNKQGVISTYLKMGVLSDASHNQKKALEYYDTVLALTKNEPLSPNIVFLYNNIATIYGQNGNMAKATEYLQKALSLSDKPEYTGVRILSLMNMGIVYEQSHDLPTALKYLNDALTLAKERNLPEDEAKVLINIASVTSQSSNTKAVELLNEAMAIAKDLGQKGTQLEIYEYLVDNYKDMKDYKNALLTLQQENILKDSVFNLDKAKEIANIQSEFELDKKNARLEELQILGHKNLLQRNIIIMVAIVMAITLIVLTFFLRKITLLNEKLFKREEELQKSNTVKDKLFSIIGHDLRGPIANIPVMLRILQDESTSDEERHYIYDTLVEHSEASLETLDKLLYWGQAQIKGIGLKSVNFNPEKYLVNDIQLVKSSTDQKHITVINKVPGNLSVHGDPAHFDFIIRNLISNAIKFTHIGGTVTVSADRNGSDGFTVFAVQDTGVGISKEKTAEIFEPFSNSTRGTADERGTSIGLMLCKEFILQNGGRIWVESEEGKGSTFFFSFKTS